MTKVSDNIMSDNCLEYEVQFVKLVFFIYQISDLEQTLL